MPPEYATAAQPTVDMIHQMGWTWRGTFQTFAMLAAIPGIVAVVIGVSVRGGGIGSAVAGIIFTSVLTLVIGFLAVNGLVSAAGGDMRGLGGFCLVGIPLAAAPGKARIMVRTGDGTERPVPYTIGPKQYSEQRLKVAPGTVDLSPADLARYERERAFHPSFS